jgi:transposase
MLFPPKGRRQARTGKEAGMIIVGCDFHPAWQQIAWRNTETGENGLKKLVHSSGQAEVFYRHLPPPALVGLESTGNSHWFVDMVTGFGHEVWVGDAAQVRASCVRHQKTDKRDAQHLLTLLIEGRFPRIWAPSKEERDQRQLIIHRHRLVTMRSRVKNELQHLALDQGVQRKAQLWSRAGRDLLAKLPLKPWASQRRQDLDSLLALLDRQISLLDRAVAEAAQANEKARLLMSQPGVGPVTALAFVLTLGDAGRFPRGKNVASYLGLIPRENSSGGLQRLGPISKQGNKLVRTLLVEASRSVVRHDPEFKTQYEERCHHRPTAVATVAAARKLAIRLYWMLRTNTPYPEITRSEGSPRDPLVD